MPTNMTDFKKEEVDAIYYKVTKLIESSAFMNDAGQEIRWFEIADEIDKKFRNRLEKNMAFIILGYKMGVERAKQEQLKIGGSLIARAKELMKQLGGDDE